VLKLCEVIEFLPFFISLPLTFSFWRIEVSVICWFHDRHLLRANPECFALAAIIGLLWSYFNFTVLLSSGRSPPRSKHYLTLVWPNWVYQLKARPRLGVLVTPPLFQLASISSWVACLHGFDPSVGANCWDRVPRKGEPLDMEISKGSQGYTCWR
jgi:hypothetical protein